MAYNIVKGNGPNIHLISGVFTTDANGDPNGITAGSGFTVSKNGEGDYRITLSDSVRAIHAAQVTPLSASVADVLAQVKAVSASGGTVDFSTYTTESQSTDHSTIWHKPAADGAAGDATAEIPIYRAPVAGTVTAVHYTPEDTLTANDTNYATLTLYKRDSDGSNQAAVASVTTETTGSGDWTAFASEALTVSSGALTAGQGLSVAITKTGTGVVVPEGTLTVYYTKAASASAATDYDSGTVHFMIAAELA